MEILIAKLKQEIIALKKQLAAGGIVPIKIDKEPADGDEEDVDVDEATLEQADALIAEKDMLEAELDEEHKETSPQS